MPQSLPKLLIAASGTGGHLFPAIATAEQLTDFQIEWLGVPDRLERQLVPDRYSMHTIRVEGFQQRFGIGTLKIFSRLLLSILKVRQLLQQGSFQALLTTGGYIAAPSILAARSLGLPVVLHESNALPGKVTRWLSPFCDVVAIGFAAAADRLPRAKTVCVGTPVRSQFRPLANLAMNLPSAQLDLPIPADAPLIVVFGGSQGAVGLNKLVRQAASAWFDAGFWVVHLTGESDPDAQTLSHPQYFCLPFYDNMAGLLQRADLAISRAGAGSLTELAVTATPSILIPYPYAAEDHQSYNAAIFKAANAALVFQQSELTSDLLESKVLHLLRSPDQLHSMAVAAGNLATADSAEQLAAIVRQLVKASVSR
ncbi:MAG: undecaprenyldiphospho-muramoylpentapeptide beta-N-acetylglucosaminyltransferase [Drouetiella hepatica Uher 2000/2452]|uniref:UDP-N-acetylglucosamine--N-acetylmuramyl-(pentapeptide) pyrophosphoryl-undecaprenol N-acetylglucosamine transferase n=1 Tax=Drouetiella hepatica Uher 2000/2452 TaxID=904376 RepID=A0A951UN73_9CYAN|nr:undecaprenyldiphospho-muramoylpentapeptide beta-N-acetylglucosaminyltransferase [Drouetiella hepatica Uher 2000/2452]